MQPQLRALFFDFDGVIVDSVPTKTEAFRTLFIDYPPDVIQKVLSHHRQHGGISRVEKIANAHAEYIGSPLTGGELELWAGRYSKLVVESVVAENWIKGAKEFLDSVHNSPLKSFVISGTPESELNYILERRGISDYFHERLGSPVKKPKHIRNLIEKYHLEPAECLFIGDAYTDYDAAMETGLHFIGIQGDVIFPDGTIVLDDCSGLQSSIKEIFSQKLFE